MADRAVACAGGATILERAELAAVESLQRVRDAARRLAAATAVLPSRDAAFAASDRLDLQSVYRRPAIHRRASDVSVRASVPERATVTVFRNSILADRL